MRLAVFITPHGFGHAARACAVMDAIHQREKNSFFDIFTRVPRWFFEDSLPGGCFRYHEHITDIGLVQASPLTADLDATLEKLPAFIPFSPDVLNSLGDTVTQLGCRVVICDVSPLGIAVAQAAGLPSVLIENFTWDWIYADYVKTHPGFQPIIDQLDRVYRSATVHIQTDPVCRVRPETIRLGPISRHHRSSRQRMRARLNCDRARVVLVTMGGIATRHPFTAQLKKRPDIHFILPQEIARPMRERNLIHLPQHSGYYHPDLIQAADAVVGKAGYSTLAEVCHAGKPFAYITRDGFRESRVLGDYADRYAAGMEIPASEFDSAGWVAQLDRLLGRGPGVAPVANAVDRAAEIVCENAY